MRGENYEGDMGEDQDQDAMMSALQKSLIAETLSGARAHIGGKASLNEPSRPFTPGDMPRHLIYGNDYSNRPGSSYKMNNVIGQAADEFVNFSAVKTQANTESQYQKSMVGSEEVLSIIERHSTQTKKDVQSKIGGKMPQMRQALPGVLLPSLDPQSFTKRSS